MKELILDLRDIEPDGGDSFADSPDIQQLEVLLFDYIGKIIRVKITETAESVLEGKNNKKVSFTVKPKDEKRKQISFISRR